MITFAALSLFASIAVVVGVALGARGLRAQVAIALAVPLAWWLA